MKRYVVIWFRHLLTDRLLIRHPKLSAKAFVLAAKQRSRIVVMASSRQAEKAGIEAGMVVADARAVMPGLEVMEYEADMAEKLLNALAEWMIRYSPTVAVDLPDGLIIDATGCAHLWGGETAYLKDIASRLKGSGYDVRTAMADTIGAAWAISRHSRAFPIIMPGEQLTALLPLPAAALRLDGQVLEKMYKLGLYAIKSFISIPRSTLRRRFGQATLDQIDKALGLTKEYIKPVLPAEPYQERLPSLEPIRTATGIEIALERLLEGLCKKLATDKIGARQLVLTCYRVDGQVQQIGVGTNAPSCSASHLYKLLKLKISDIKPDLGIELFVLSAPVVEPLYNPQEALWDLSAGNKLVLVAEFLDRLSARAGSDVIHRYLPAEHHWPERSAVQAVTLDQKPSTEWPCDLIRPIQILAQPEKIYVSVPVPDYPPMLFGYKGTIHTIKYADGPDRIEQEWWISDGLHRDYYSVEDQHGRRYWVFRLGHYADEGAAEWFIHGFFA